MPIVPPPPQSNTYSRICLMIYIQDVMHSSHGAKRLPLGLFFIYDADAFSMLIGFDYLASTRRMRRGPGISITPLAGQLATHFGAEKALLYSRRYSLLAFIMIFTRRQYVASDTLDGYIWPHRRRYASACAPAQRKRFCLAHI